MRRVKRISKESGNPFVNDKVRRATAEEIDENFAKEMKALEESDVKFSTVTIDSYNNIREE